MTESTESKKSWQKLTWLKVKNLNWNILNWEYKILTETYLIESIKSWLKLTWLKVKNLDWNILDWEYKIMTETYLTESEKSWLDDSEFLTRKLPSSWSRKRFSAPTRLMDPWYHLQKNMQRYCVWEPIDFPVYAI